MNILNLLSESEVALGQIRSHLCPWLTLCGHRAMTWTVREESLFSHQTSCKYWRSVVLPHFDTVGEPKKWGGIR